MDTTRVDASLYNPDLAPIPAEKRSWGTYNYASLWVAMSVCIPTYMLASGLIAGGMSWLQAVLTALVACGWFGIQAWIGGQAIYSMLRIVWPGGAGVAGSSSICFFVFWA